MKYLEADFIINCNYELLQTARDLLAAMAGEAGFEAFNDTDLGIKGYVQETLFDKHVLDDAISAFPVGNVIITYTISSVDDVDWNERWESAGFEPITVDDKVVIYDATHTRMEQLNSWKNLICVGIDAKLAFGTGSHQTTRMIISFLLGTLLKGKRVLDCGCGTGILGIVASKLGAKTVFGYDIDDWSVRNSALNARVNNVNNLTVTLGDAGVLRKNDDIFDVILANINRNILLADMDRWVAHASPNAVFIMSGFYDNDITMLLSRAAELGLTEVDRRVNDHWACLELRYQG